ncbi:MAG: hypothetical protein QF907_07255 [Nitrospinota bacterium]|nr:hypothetical protein [Nitrospinota bacterium]MDP7350755.1 hypothetical protein [Nitrospinota bacterium]MDP7581318.1 hypothetical protein [Nitrospinota bacterium]HJN03406.1 hypothetical protein [Nitrospinota bacterium]
MNSNDSLLQSLIELAEKLSVRVIFKNLKDDEFVIKSGMCSIKGDTLIIIDSRVSLEEKVKTLCKELKKFNLDNIFISPAMRDILQGQNESF